MAKNQYEHLITYQTPEFPAHPTGSFPGTEMFVVDDRIIRGAPRLMVAWFTGPWDKKIVYKPHAHSADEYCMFLGSNPDNPRDLGGEVEFWIKDEKYILTKSCAIYIPKMLQHAPMWPKKVNNPRYPILFVGAVAGIDKSYYSNDPKWKDWADPFTGPDVGVIDW
jgi:hypothetical protein